MSGCVCLRLNDDLFDVTKEKHELDVKPVKLMPVGEVSSDSDFKMDGWGVSRVRGRIVCQMIVN